MSKTISRPESRAVQQRVAESPRAGVCKPVEVRRSPGALEDREPHRLEETGLQHEATEVLCVELRAEQGLDAALEVGEGEGRWREASERRPCGELAPQEREGMRHDQAIGVGKGARWSRLRQTRHDAKGIEVRIAWGRVLAREDLRERAPAEPHRVDEAVRHESGVGDHHGVRLAVHQREHLDDRVGLEPQREQERALELLLEACADGGDLDTRQGVRALVVREQDEGDVSIQGERNERECESGRAQRRRPRAFG